MSKAIKTDVLYIDGFVSGLIINSDRDFDSAELHEIVNIEFLSEEIEHQGISADSKIKQGWFRKVPARDECNDYCGWVLRSAKERSRGAFFGTEIYF
jgi:hypothetical protein